MGFVHQSVIFSIMFVIAAPALLFACGAGWRIFVKAGFSGWECLIPVYSIYIMIKIAGRPGWLGFLLLVPWVNLIIYLVICCDFARKFDRSTLFSVGLFLLPFIFFPVLGYGPSCYTGTPPQEDLEEERWSGIVAKITCSVVLVLISSLVAHCLQNPDIRIILAQASGRTETVKDLLAKGADVNARNFSGVSILAWAAQDGRTEIAKALLARGADVNAKDSRGVTALMSAASHGHTEIVKALLDKGADVNAKDKKGRTALMEAAVNGYTGIVQALLAKSADIDAKDDDGKDAVEYARRFGHVGIINILLEEDVRRKAAAKVVPVAQHVAPIKLERISDSTADNNKVERFFTILGLAGVEIGGRKYYEDYTICGGKITRITSDKVTIKFGDTEKVYSVSDAITGAGLSR